MGCLISAKAVPFASQKVWNGFCRLCLLRGIWGGYLVHTFSCCWYLRLLRSPCAGRCIWMAFVNWYFRLIYNLFILTLSCFEWLYEWFRIGLYRELVSIGWDGRDAWWLMGCCSFRGLLLILHLCWFVCSLNRGSFWFCLTLFSE